MKIIILAACLLLLMGCSHQQCFGPDDLRQPSKQAHSILYTGQQGFSLALLQAVNQLMPHENLFFSPYSTYHALMIAYFIAANQTETYLRNVLRFNDTQTKADIYSAYKWDKFTSAIKAKNATYEFTNANKIYVANQVPISSCIENYFSDELTLLGFRDDPEGARKTINTWVENETHNMIQDLLPYRSIAQDTTLVLVNAAYFKGFWVNKFDPTKTKQEVFYVSPTKQIMVDMMHVEGDFFYDVSESLKAHVLEMPYQGGNISMFVLLPPFSKPDAIDYTLKSLTLDKLKALVEGRNLMPRTVQVGLPKFSLEQTIELVPVLERMGVGDLFQATADFSTLTNANTSLGEAVHKAKIVVDEEGSQAAAATVLFTFRSSRPIEPARFICNHPFIYLIYDNVEKSILFSGVFRRPH